MSRENSAVASGETRLMPDVLQAWIFDEKVILSPYNDCRFMELDDLLTKPMLHEFLSLLKPVPFYRYMVRYLLARYPELCEESPEVQALPAAERPAALAKAVYAEIETGGKSKKLQNRLRQKVLQSFEHSGFLEEDGRVRGSLTDPSQCWEYGRLREVLLSDTIDEGKFFLLALGLHMAIEDVTAFLQKVLLRRPLDPLVPLEGLLEVCLQTDCPNRYGLFQVLWKSFSECMQIINADEKELSKHKKVEPDRSNIKKKLSALQSKCTGYPAATVSVQTEMQDYAWAVVLADWTKLPENQAFRSLIKKTKNAFEKLDKQETRQYGNLPAGTIEVYYEPDKPEEPQEPLKIFAGTVFCDAEGHEIAESLQTVSAADSGIGREISFEVFSKTPIFESGSPVEKHQVFRCKLAPDKELQLKNKSRIKETHAETPDQPVFQRATLTGLIPGGAEIPARTEFQCKVCKDRKKCKKTGQCDSCEDAESCPNCKTITMINREPLSFNYLEVPVQALPPEKGEPWPEAIPRNTITAEGLPEKDRITKITHSRLTTRLRSDKNASLFMEYFYGPRDIGDYIDDEEGLPLDEYPRLLTPILRGMRLSDARISQINTTGYPAVKRHELLTAVFLHRAMTLYKNVPEDLSLSQNLSADLPQDGQDQGCDLQKRADAVLHEAGFYGVYLPNPYDSLLAYLSLCLYPADIYRRLWGMVRQAK